MLDDRCRYFDQATRDYHHALRRISGVERYPLRIGSQPHGWLSPLRFSRRFGSGDCRSLVSDERASQLSYYVEDLYFITIAACTQV